ncbi:MAG: hypothetical protein KGR46_00475 [Verrucomicrobia bacterium]|nr:hypothetical protein [Verrucomicrobiota bacterium]
MAPSQNYRFAFPALLQFPNFAELSFDGSSQRRRIETGQFLFQPIQFFLEVALEGLQFLERRHRFIVNAPAAASPNLGAHQLYHRAEDVAKKSFFIGIQVFERLRYPVLLQPPVA